MPIEFLVKTNLIKERSEVSQRFLYVDILFFCVFLVSYYACQLTQLSAFSFQLKT